MSSDHRREKRNNIFRVDRFDVPADARREFLERVASTHALLRRQAGFVQDIVLEQESGPGRYNFVTLVEWKSAEAIGKAAGEVARMHAETGFDRTEMMKRLGIVADIASYRPVALESARQPTA